MDILTIVIIVIAFAALAQGAMAVTSSGSVAGRLSPAQIAQYAADAGFSGSDLAVSVAVALAESGGDPNAVGDVGLAPHRGPSRGLWQINVGDYAHPEYAQVNLFDPATNAAAAYAVYEAAGYTFGPWSTYGGGQYLAFLDQAQAVTA